MVFWKKHSVKHDSNFLIFRFGDFFQQDMFYLEDLGVMESIMKEYLPDFAVRGKFEHQLD